MRVKFLPVIAIAALIVPSAFAKKKITGSLGTLAAVGQPGTSSFTIKSKTAGKKRTLSVTYNLTLSGLLYPFTFNVSGKAK